MYPTVHFHDPMIEIEVRRTTCYAAFCVLQVALLAMPAPVEAQVQPAEVQFVFGSDTSSPGLNVARHTLRFTSGHLSLYTSPTGAAAAMMDDARRARYRDRYGTPLKMTWWMQVGSLYETARNTNVPLASTQTLHLMRAYWKDALDRHGDEVSLHYHSWVWSDYNGDGIPYWNQALTYAEFRDGFDRALAQSLLDEEIFPVSFRSGWHYMDNAWQARLDSLLPFSMHNASPYRGRDVTEPLDNLLDWSRAPTDFVPFRPSADDYQVPGGSGGWNVRSIDLNQASEARIRDIFEQARAGTAQVACVWGHLADSAFVDDLERAAERVVRIAAEYPDVPFRFSTAVEAMQRWLQSDDATSPRLGVSEIVQGEDVVLRITSDEPIFQSIPFVALKDRYEQFHVLGATKTGAGTWETEPFHRADAARVAVAVTDSVGNLAQTALAFLPDDRYFDNRDAAYEETAGTWQTVQAAEGEEIWGTDYRVAVVEPSQRAAVRWTPALADAARYNVFFRLPAVSNPAGDLTVRVRVGGAVVDSLYVTSPPPSDEWVFAGQADLDPAQPTEIEVVARGTGSGTVRFAADALRLSALLRDRQLDIAEPTLNIGDVVYGDTAWFSLPVRNLGTARLTVTGVTSTAGHAYTPAPLPFVLEGQETLSLPLYLLPPAPGVLADTLLLASDDPLRPLLRVPVVLRALDYFVVVDDADPTGYTEQGAWFTSVTEAYGAASRYAPLWNTADASATFSVTVERGGYFDFSILVPSSTNSARHAAYTVHVGDGGRVDSLVIDQNQGSGAWRSLGLYPLPEGARFTVRVAPTQIEDVRVLRTDAIRLSFLGEALREQIVDNDDMDYSESGPWRQSVAQAYEGSSRFVDTGADAVATFRMETQQEGFHAFYQIVPHTVNASRQAEYRVVRNGSLAGSAVVDQNVGSGSWQFLGSYYLYAGDSVAVEVRQGGPWESGRVLRADAVKMVSAQAVANAEVGPQSPPSLDLEAAYPNPARSLVHFRYHLDRPAHARLRVFDVLGREVARLVNDAQGPGAHTVTFDASHLSGGVYFSRLEAGAASVVRRWVLLP